MAFILSISGSKVGQCTLKLSRVKEIGVWLFEEFDLLCLTKDNKYSIVLSWWTCRGNADYGVINNDKNEEKQHQLIPTLIPILYTIINIECGRKHVLCLDSFGNVWCFGFNEHGQLSLNMNTQYVCVASICVDHPLKCNWSTNHSMLMNNAVELFKVIIHVEDNLWMSF